MRTLLLVSALAFIGAGAAGAAGCSKADHSSSAPVVATVTVDELDQMLARHDVQPVDANGDSTRRKLGVIPGAVLLDDIDAVDKLPPDRTRNLVFYCANPECGASHEAAEHAIVAGYTHVKVLPDGIAGWVKAGKKTESL